MFKFIHAADIHLDSQLRGLEKYDGAPVQEIREAARRALTNLVTLAIEEGVAFVLIAGDLYDGDWHDMNTGYFFVREASRLSHAGIPLYLVSGNHDAQNRITRSLRLPENVTTFSSDRAETFTLEEPGVAIHGQSFAEAAVYANLSESYPVAKSGYLNIGLLHTSADGRDGHDRYAPCSLEELKSKGYDYWALGHVHKREVLCEKPFIAFPGNVQGRHIRETGAKGCYLVSVDNRSVSTEFKALDVLRWELVQVDLGGSETLDDLMDAVSLKVLGVNESAEGRALAIRLVLTGQSKVHRLLLSDTQQLRDDLRALIISIGGGSIWLEKVKVQTAGYGPMSEAQSAPGEALTQLAKLVEEVSGSPEELSGLGFDCADIRRKLPGDIKSLAEFRDKKSLDSLLAEAHAMLLDRLLKSGAAK